MYTLTRAEQETVIVWDAEARTATIDTADPVTLRKLEKLAAQYPDVYQLVSEDRLYNARRYEVPAKYIRFGKPASDAQREAADVRCEPRKRRGYGRFLMLTPPARGLHPLHRHRRETHQLPRQKQGGLHNRPTPCSMRRLPCYKHTVA